MQAIITYIREDQHQSIVFTDESEDLSLIISKHIKELLSIGPLISYNVVFIAPKKEYISDSDFMSFGELRVSSWNS